MILTRLGVLASSFEATANAPFCCPEWSLLGADQYKEYNIDANGSIVGTAPYTELYEGSPSFAIAIESVDGRQLYVYDGNSFGGSVDLTRTSVNVDGTTYNPATGFQPDEICVYIEFTEGSVNGPSFDLDFNVVAVEGSNNEVATTNFSITSTEFQNNPGKIYQVSVPLNGSTEINKVRFTTESYPVAVIHDIRVCKNEALLDYPYVIAT